MVEGHQSGGSFALGELIDEHGAALYRDFLLYYHIDLSEALRKGSRYAPRLLLSLIERLPEGSEFVAEQLGGREHRDWDQTNHLLAAIYNAVVSDTLVMANVPKHKRADVPMIEPPSIKSESVERKPKSRTTLAEIAARLAPQ